MCLIRLLSLIIHPHLSGVWFSMIQEHQKHIHLRKIGLCAQIISHFRLNNQHD